MIKFMMTNPETKRKILGLIIAQENIDKLKDEKPIHFHAEEIHQNEIKVNEIIIMYYPTLELAIEDLKVKNLITDDTIRVEKFNKEH